MRHARNRCRRRAKRIHYGEDPSQFADLRLPTGEPVGTLVLLHGGYWQPGYGLDQLDAIANLMTDRAAPPGTSSTAPSARAALARPDDRRRARASTGSRQEDLAAARRAPRPLRRRSPRRLGRLPHRADSRRTTAVGPVGAISLAGVLDLTRAATAPGPSTPVQRSPAAAPTSSPSTTPSPTPRSWSPRAARCGRSAPRTTSWSRPSRPRRTSPPPGQPVRRAELVSVPGDHFTLIDPGALVPHDQGADRLGHRANPRSAEPR